MRRRLLALCVAGAALAALVAAPAYAAPGGDAPEVDGELVGCGTDTPEFTVNLVGRKGGFWFNNAIYHPDSALAAALPVPSALEYTLGATLAPGDYDVSTISVDNHTEDPFRLLFGIVDRSPIESYGLAFDLGGAGEVITPGRVPDLPDDDNWYADVPLATEVPAVVVGRSRQPALPAVGPGHPARRARQPARLLAGHGQPGHAPDLGVGRTHRLPRRRRAGRRRLASSPTSPPSPAPTSTTATTTTATPTSSRSIPTNPRPAPTPPSPATASSPG